MKNVNFRDFFLLILCETKPGRPDVKSSIFPTLVDSHGHNQQHSLQIRQHCWYCQETAESAENHSRVFFSIFQNQIESNVLSESKTEPMVTLKDLEIQTNQENIILYSVKAGFSESTIKVYFSKTTLL